MSNQTSITVIICYKIKKIKVLSKIKIIKLCRYFKQILIKNTLLSNIVFCFAPYFRRANTVRRCVISITLFHSYNLFLSQYFCHCLRASNERPYSLVCTNYLHELAVEALGYRIAKTITMLRSGIKVFDLKKLSSRMKILTFGGNWIII